MLRKKQASNQTSYDLTKAFDSTSKGLMRWSWIRMGVPKSAANWMVLIDVNGTTVVKSPMAMYVWDMLPYGCVQTAGAYPPGCSPSTEDSKILPFFCAKRRTGQGDPPSTINFMAVDNIMATGLRILDTKLACPTYVAGADNGIYVNGNNRYADDSQSGSYSAAVIQKKAELVSAYCIVFGLKLSSGKI